MMIPLSAAALGCNKWQHMLGLRGVGRLVLPGSGAFCNLLVFAASGAVDKLRAISLARVASEEVGRIQLEVIS